MAQTMSVGARRKSNLDKVVLSTKLIAAVVLTVGVALGYIHVKFMATELGYDISVNRGREEELLKEKRLLEAELMKLKSPERIEALARGMGFKFPTQEDVIFTQERTVVGESR